MNARDKELRFGHGFQLIGCIACSQLGRYSQPEVHHLIRGNKRRGDEFTVPLCPAHHRGVGHVSILHGPSLAHGSKPFRERFGSDEYLLEQTNLRLGELL
jgi:hypothetical protein